MEEKLLKQKLKTTCENLARIYFISKVLHWNATKYDTHLLYDRIAEDCIDSIDTIAESCIFPFFKITDLDVKIDKFNLQSLKDKIQETAETIQEICQDKQTSEGTKNTLSGIAEKLNIKAYLINNNL